MIRNFHRFGTALAALLLLQMALRAQKTTYTLDTETGWYRFTAISTLLEGDNNPEA
ncbi:MAG: hypothetical protein IPO90_04145 [Flavobacteriales bacterium]|nr:hypothetical protein [Flavobacteriales bacterium]